MFYSSSIIKKYFIIKQCFIILNNSCHSFCWKGLALIATLTLTGFCRPIYSLTNFSSLGKTKCSLHVCGFSNNMLQPSPFKRASLEERRSGKKTNEGTKLEKKGCPCMQKTNWKFMAVSGVIRKSNFHSLVTPMLL